MNLYKPGDICYGIHLGIGHREYEYMICTVEEAFPHLTFQDGTSGPGYKVLWRVPGGKLDAMIVSERHLKLRSFFVDKSSWDILEGYCKTSFREKK